MGMGIMVGDTVEGMAANANEGGGFEGNREAGGSMLSMM